MSGQAYLERVASCLSRLPGIGRRSAERLANHLAANADGLLGDLMAALGDVATHVRLCTRCGGLTTAAEPLCRLCTGANRDPATLCVVEDPSDILAIERSGSYRGRYHVLMGKVSPMHGESPEDLRLESLFKRIDDERYQEVVVALGMDVESDATASYINECLRNRGVRVTRLAVGIPAGSGIMYSDPVTLARAMKGRQSV